MEIIEFLQRSEQKNIKCYIGGKVKQKLKEYEMQLTERQQMLRNILQFENMQYDEELVQLLNERLEDQFKKRLEWINTKRLERESAEQELLKLKNQQKELANCQEWRQMQTRQLLLESKEAQLYQIEEKKVRKHKESLMERMWLETMERLRQEKEFQEIYENKLRKVIDGSNQMKNQELYNNNKSQQQLQNEQLKKEFEEDNNRASNLDLKYRKDENLREILNKTRQDDLLKSQIAINREKKRLADQLTLEEDIIQKARDDKQILMELDQTERQKVRNNEWHKCYLENCLKEKQQKQQEDKEFEQMYLNTGCILQQSLKKPYCRNAR